MQLIIITPKSLSSYRKKSAQLSETLLHYWTVNFFNTIVALPIEQNAEQPEQKSFLLKTRLFELQHFTSTNILTH